MKVSQPPVVPVVRRTAADRLSRCNPMWRSPEVPLWSRSTPAHHNYFNRNFSVTLMEQCFKLGVPVIYEEDELAARPVALQGSVLPPYCVVEPCWGCLC